MGGGKEKQKYSRICSLDSKGVVWDRQAMTEFYNFTQDSEL